MTINLSQLPNNENNVFGRVGLKPDKTALSNLPIRFNSWSDFYSRWGDKETHFSTVINFYFEEAARDENDNVMEVSLIMWVIHPNIGASKEIRVNFIKEKELEEVKMYLSKHLTQIKKWFEWVEGKNENLI